MIKHIFTLPTVAIVVLLFLPLPADEFKSTFPEYTRTWIGSDYWSNRLQDWRVTMGRLECLNGESRLPMRATHWLSGEIDADSDEAFTIQIRTGTLGFVNAADGSAWSGLLIGGGGGKLDYRSASLIHHYPGKGGGILAVFDDQGSARFLSNESEEQNKRETLASSAGAANRINSIGNFEDYHILLSVSEARNGLRSLTLSVTDLHTGSKVAETVLRNIPKEQIYGGIAMISNGGELSERRFWFRDFAANGDGIRLRPERRFGPVLGAIYSRSGSNLKLNAQFPPLGFGDASSATLELRPPNSNAWITLGEATIESPSYTAVFEIDDYQWNERSDFRIRYQSQGIDHFFEGSIAAAPIPKNEVKIAGLTCYQVMARPADGGWGDGFIGSPDGRWSQENVWFPHNSLIESVNRQNPDLIALLGDQIYEGGNPTNSDPSEGNPHLDYLYKWYITLWDLGRLTRNFPTVVLTDDHDIYQGDLWGDGGTASANGQNKDGGYVHEPEFVRMVERTQTAANPDPTSTAPLKQGLTSYYTSFAWGDVDIALIEDRKFKSLPTLIGPAKKNGSKIIEPHFDVSKIDMPGSHLLGAAQETALQNWVQTNPDRVKIGLTQTTYASLHTDPSGEKWIDLDSGGWPQNARNRALRILRQGNALLMSGDTHLPSVVQHGIDAHRDSVWQFTVPAVANKYRRWWTPSENGKNRVNDAPGYTGDHFDGFGNRITIAAAGNPTISNTEVFAENKRRGKGYASEHLLLDRAVTKDGYGLIIISPDRKTVTLECWPVDSANQHPGWPIILQRNANSALWSQR